MIRHTRRITPSSKVINALLLLQLPVQLLSVALMLLSSTIDVVDAFSSGAGGCEGGMAAAGGLHLDDSNGRPVMSGTLIDGDIEVTLDGVVLTPNTPLDVPTQQDLMITVNALDISYLGVLIRLEAPDGVDTVGTLLPGANIQPANACAAPVIGVTHMDSTEKTMVTGFLRFDTEVTDVILDISIVFINGADGSAYAYDRFNVNFRQATVPTTAPTALPVEVPVEIPVEPPVEVPIEVPIEPPVEVPIEVPIEPPINTPIEAPVPSTDEPSVESTNAPTVESTNAPTVESTDAPSAVRVPVDSPILVRPTDEPTIESPIDSTEEPTVLLKDTRSPAEQTTNEPSSDDTDNVLTPSPTIFDDDFKKGMKKGKGKGKGRMMMRTKGNMMGKRNGGKGKGNKGATKSNDDDTVEVAKKNNRAKLFRNEYVDHHRPSTAKSEHNKRLHIEILEHVPFEP